MNTIAQAPFLTPSKKLPFIQEMSNSVCTQNKEIKLNEQQIQWLEGKQNQNAFKLVQHPGFALLQRRIIKRQRAKPWLAIQFKANIGKPLKWYNQEKLLDFQVVVEVAKKALEYTKHLNAIFLHISSYFQQSIYLDKDGSQLFINFISFDYEGLHEHFQRGIIGMGSLLLRQTSSVVRIIKRRLKLQEFQKFDSQDGKNFEYSQIFVCQNTTDETYNQHIKTKKLQIYTLLKYSSNHSFYNIRPSRLLAQDSYIVTHTNHGSFNFLLKSKSRLIPLILN